MSDDLTVAGGGLTAVATDELFVQAYRMAAVARNADLWCARLRESGGVAGGAGVRSGARDIQAAVMALERAGADAQHLSAALLAAADSYGELENRLFRSLHSQAAGAAWLMGRLAPLMLPMIALASLSLVLPTTGLLIASALSGDTTGQILSRLWQHHQGLLSSPAVIALIRVAVASLDDAQAGMVGIPLAPTMLLGDDGLGVLGLATVVRSLVAAVPGPALTETIVTAIPRASRQVSAPRGIADLADRIPDPGRGGEQIRIERYGNPGEPRWIIYLGGTVHPGVVPAGEPFDMTSNLHALAGESAGSERAATAALRAAGASDGDLILAVGYSQGALVAARLVASGEYRPAALLSFGGPIGRINTGAAVPVLSVEHADDLVPALDGAGPGRQLSGAERITVSRTVYDGSPPPDGGVLSAHQLATYRDTAALIQASAEPRLQDYHQVVAAFGAGVGTATLWRAERVR